MRLHNGTLLRGYLAHIQALVRTLAALSFERNAHPDAETLRKLNPQLREEWEQMDRDLKIVLGVEAELVPFHQLATRGGTFHTQNHGSCRDPFRITFKALKLKADRARWKHPEVKLLLKWDSNAPSRNYTDEELEDIKNQASWGSYKAREQMKKMGLELAYE